MHPETGMLMCFFLILLSTLELSYGSNSSLTEEVILDVTTAASNSEHSVKFSAASSLTKLTISSIVDNSAPMTHVHTIGSDNSQLSSGKDVMLLPSQTMSFEVTETTAVPGEEMIWSDLVHREKGTQTDAPEPSLSVSSNFPPDDARVTSSENEISPSITMTQMTTRSSEVTVIELSNETEKLMISGSISLIVLESLKTVGVSPTPVLNEESTALETVPGDHTQDSPSLGVWSSETSHSHSGTILT